MTPPRMTTNGTRSDSAAELEPLLDSLTASAAAIADLVRLGAYDDALRALVARDATFAQIRTSLLARAAEPTDDGRTAAIVERLVHAQQAQVALAETMAGARDAVREELHGVERRLAAGDGYPNSASGRVGGALDVRQ